MWLTYFYLKNTYFVFTLGWLSWLSRMLDCLVIFRLSSLHVRYFSILLNFVHFIKCVCMFKSELKYYLTMKMNIIMFLIMVYIFFYFKITYFYFHLSWLSWISRTSNCFMIFRLSSLHVRYFLILFNFMYFIKCVRFEVKF